MIALKWSTYITLTCASKLQVPVRLFWCSIVTSKEMGSSCKELFEKKKKLWEIHVRKGDAVFKFGTAGFRAKGDVLDHIMFRMGILAVLRSKERKRAIGVMITASHNPQADNGVKLVDPAGEMLASAWETHATLIGNAENQDLLSVVDDLIAKENIDMNEKATIIVGRDTRRSSPALAKAVTDGIQLMNGDIIDYGYITTPILHFMVVCHNTSGAYGEPTTTGYYTKLSNAFKSIFKMRPIHGNYKPELTVDASNAVGSLAMLAFMAQLDEFLKITLVNDGSAGILNHQCGADFVKVNKQGYVGIQPDIGRRYASLDGDADRLIYFFYDQDLKFHMLDGDKIAVLIADYLNELVKASKMNINLGLVQTAYANGSSTNYMKDILGLPVTCTPTGVKYLHHEAIKYDIGVYFEANGHGTIVFSPKAEELIKNAAKIESNPASVELGHFLNLINSTVGDAISDMLTVEAILQARGWTAADWNQMYTDLPNRLGTVNIKDRYSVETTDAERVCVKPEGLQNRIDTLVSKYKHGRSFVRPSGTEDLIRVYAEADTSENADKLAAEVSLAVYEFCDGVGPKPTIPA